MTKLSKCRICDGVGILLICYAASNDYDVAACQCPKGKWWRTPHQLRAWAALQTPPPGRIGRLEEFYTEQAIAELPSTVEDGPSIAEMFGS